MKLKKYNEIGDLDEHVQHMDDCLSYHNVDEEAKFKLFELTLTRSTRLWFKSFPYESVESWTDLSKSFTARFTTW